MEFIYTYLRAFPGLAIEDVFETFLYLHLTLHRQLYAFLLKHLKLITSQNSIQKSISESHFSNLFLVPVYFTIPGIFGVSSSQSDQDDVRPGTHR